MLTLSIGQRNKIHTMKEIYFYLLLWYLCFYFLFYSNTKLNSSFPSQKISEIGNLDSNLISPQNKQNQIAEFMQTKFENPKLEQSDTANLLRYSNSTLQRYTNDINMRSPYRVQPILTNKRSKKVSNANLDNNSHRQHDLERLEMTSNGLAKPETNTEATAKRTSNKRNKNYLKGGSLHKAIENNDGKLDEILHKNNT